MTMDDTDGRGCERPFIRVHPVIRGQNPFSPNPLRHFLQQGEILVTREAGRLEVVANDEHWNFLVSRNDYRAGHARLDSGAMAALLTDELKANGEEERFHRAPMLRSEP